MINVAAKQEDGRFNSLFESYTPSITSNLDKFSSKDLVLILSSIGSRVSKNMVGSHDLTKTESVQRSITVIADMFVSKKWVEKQVNYNELATLIWCFGMQEKTYSRFPELWTAMQGALENFA